MNLELKRSAYEVNGSVLNEDNKLITITAYIPQILITMNDHLLSELKSKKRAYILMTNLYNEDNKIKEMKINKIIPINANYVKYAVVGSSYVNNSTNIILNINKLIDQVKLDKLLPNYLKGYVIKSDTNYLTNEELNIYIPKEHRKDNIYPNDYVRVIKPMGKDKYKRVTCIVNTIDNINRHQKQEDSLFQKCLLNNKSF
ncbi:hypothetical protein DY052_08510 [Apilactobacillus timberlakei]|uniref:hypothetical protein n=1 Tax=Apilactobacillus timberlakei TaxID=2008380 RepID=UPI001126D5A8|nr:hypothetical protein [Apilactobacillus timberlakei]TPR13032.1 hypothetical protein DY052_08510 [Apilactobacillus timberlakei]